MIHRGRKVLDDTIGDIRARFDPRSLLFEPLDPDADVGALARVPGIQAVRKDGSAWDLALGPGTDPAAAIRAVVGAVPPARVELRRPSLEDVFVGIVTADAGSQEALALRAAVRDEGESGGEVRR
jgi:ABC-type uncharacterized transport system ATPase subunit